MIQPDKLKIVIIEDEACIRDSLTWFLEDLGHEVMAATTPVHCDIYQGRNCTRDNPCMDVLLIDQHLPEMKGLNFIESLHKRGCKVITANILLMSGDSTSIDKKIAQKLSLSVVQKPMDFQFLEKWLSCVKTRFVDRS